MTLSHPTMTADAIQAVDIARVVPLFAKHQRSDDDTLLEAIVGLGVTQEQAIALLDFMPIAFFPRHRWRQDRGHAGSLHPIFCGPKPIGNVRFVDEPTYVAARHYAENGYETDGLDPVSMRSAEFNTMNEMLHKGTPIERMRLGPSVIMDYAPDDSSNATRPWWRFW